MITLVRLASPEDGRLESALSLYQSSFPHHEQRARESQIKILSDEAYHFDLVYDEASWAGVILYWETQDFIYVEHFCILPDLRNHNYGQRTLSLLHQRGKPVILEIDPPIDELSIRRSAFYQRAGYRLNPYMHVHPPYHSDLAGHALKIMSQPDMLSQMDYDKFRLYLENHVMA